MKAVIPMYVGQVLNDSTVQLVAPADRLEVGRFTFRHPRCGLVTVERRADQWVVTGCAKPDPAPSEGVKA